MKGQPNFRFPKVMAMVVARISSGISLLLRSKGKIGKSDSSALVAVKYTCSEFNE